MNIIEATKKAMEIGCCIARKKENGEYSSVLFPTDTRECYIVCSLMRSKERYVRWNPQAADILADDWILITESGQELSAAVP